VVPLDPVQSRDPEALLGDAAVLRRGRRYRIEVVYANGFQTVPDAHLDISTAGAPLRVSLTASPSESNVALSAPIFIE